MMLSFITLTFLRKLCVFQGEASIDQEGVALTTYINQLQPVEYRKS